MVLCKMFQNFNFYMAYVGTPGIRLGVYLDISMMIGLCVVHFSPFIWKISIRFFMIRPN